MSDYKTSIIVPKVKGLSKEIIANLVEGKEVIFSDHGISVNADVAIIDAKILIHFFLDHFASNLTEDQINGLHDDLFENASDWGEERTYSVTSSTVEDGQFPSICVGLYGRNRVSLKFLLLEEDYGKQFFELLQSFN